MPRSSGLKLAAIVRRATSSASTPNTYAAFKRIETTSTGRHVSQTSTAPNTYAAFKRIETCNPTFLLGYRSAPNTYAAFKRIETMIFPYLKLELRFPPIPMPRSSGLKPESTLRSIRRAMLPPIPMPRSSGLKLEGLPDLQCSQYQPPIPMPRSSGLKL